MMYVIGKHMQVLIESPESVARREVKPRARRRYHLFCTCTMKRREGNHCVHTLALLRDNIRPERWRDISVGGILDSPTVPVGPPEKTRLELCREIEALKARVAELELVSS